MGLAEVKKFPVLRIVEKAKDYDHDKSFNWLDRQSLLKCVLDSLEADLSAIKAWAPTGARIVDIEGRKPQMRWPDPSGRKDKRGRVREKSTTKFKLADWPELQQARIDRNSLLIQIREINEIIQRRYSNV